MFQVITQCEFQIGGLKTSYWVCNRDQKNYPIAQFEDPDNAYLFAHLMSKGIHNISKFEENK